MLKIILYCISIFLAAILLLIIIFWWQIRVPFNSNDERIIFKVLKGQSAETIASNLVKDSLIENPFIFRLYVFLAVSQYALKTGEYELSPAMSIREIADVMILGGVNEILITIPEGFSLKQVEDRLVATGLAKSGDLVNFHFINSPSILLDKPTSASLEGYLFPDTY
ncbi:MAG: endolytic transglycosylase MltG, partial [Patescibacteria group bacterium]